MLLIAQVNGKVFCTLQGAWGVQLSGTVRTANPRQEHPLDVRRGGACWRRGCNDNLGICVHGAVPHRALKGIVFPNLPKAVECCIEPVRRGRLCRVSPSSPKEKPAFSRGVTRWHSQELEQAARERAVEEQAHGQVEVEEAAESHWHCWESL